jgi:hypothetical protein
VLAAREKKLVDETRALRAQLMEQARQNADPDERSATLKVQLDHYGGPT